MSCLALGLCAWLGAAEPPTTGAELSPAPPLIAPPALPTLDALLAAARAQRLDQDPHWRNLLHWIDGLGGSRSAVDDPAFFLAPDGARDAWAELVATLRGLLDGRPGTARPDRPGSGDPVAARFPARAEFLCTRLGIDPRLLPVGGSEACEAILDAVRPQGALLVFASAYPDAPASMFGHTFLVIRGAESSPLLAQAVNYAAAMPPGAGGIAMLGGLVGLLPGRYSTLPYHRKIQEYADLDQRDLWEYRLAFTADEVRRLLRHAWELRGISTDYWFLDENCAFNLLFLIQSARPGLNLTGRAGACVLPIDTVRWITDSGFVAGLDYRPSRRATVRAALASLDEAGRRRAIAIARTGAAVGAADAVPVLDAAGEALHALAGRRAITQAEYRQRLHAVLTRRAALGTASKPPSPPVPIPPDRGHAASLAQLGGGVDDDQRFAALTLRVAQHDQLDPPAGFAAGSDVAFGEVELRWYEQRRPALHRLDAIRLAKTEAWDPLFRPWSWRFRIGVDRAQMDAAGDWRYQGATAFGIGLAADAAGALAWAQATADARVFSPDEGWSLAPGATVGALIPLPRVQLRTEAAWRWDLVGDEPQWRLGAAARGDLGCGWTLEAGAARSAQWERHATEWSARLGLHF